MYESIAWAGHRLASGICLSPEEETTIFLIDDADSGDISVNFRFQLCDGGAPWRLALFSCSRSHQRLPFWVMLNAYVKGSANTGKGVTQQREQRPSLRPAMKVISIESSRVRVPLSTGRLLALAVSYFLARVAPSRSIFAISVYPFTAAIAAAVCPSAFMPRVSAPRETSSFTISV